MNLTFLKEKEEKGFLKFLFFCQHQSINFKILHDMKVESHEQGKLEKNIYLII